MNIFIQRFIYFFIYLCFIQTLFTLFYYILNKYSLTFKNLKITTKKYIIKNLLKSFILFISIPLASYIIFLFIYENRHDPNITIIGSWIYGGCDIIGLINVKLPQNTLIHHLIVSFFVLCITMSNFYSFNLFSILILYASLCTYTFPVNLFLAFRKLYPDQNITKKIALLSYYNYIVFIIIILLTCFYCYYLLFFIYHPLFILSIMIPIYYLWKDDFILYNWIKNYISSNSID